MKKYLIALLALVMMFALAVPALAEVTPTGNTEQEVTAGYVAAENIEAAPVYRVTIDWTPKTGDTALTYTGEKTTYTWDTVGLNYTASTTAAAGWSGETGYEVKVTNYSNAEVGAAVSATANYSLTVTATGEETMTLPSAAVDSEGEIDYTETEKKGTAQTKSVTYTYKDGGSATAPEAPAASTVTIGKITVTVSTNN